MILTGFRDSQIYLGHIYLVRYLSEMPGDAKNNIFNLAD